MARRHPDASSGRGERGSHASNLAFRAAWLRIALAVLALVLLPTAAAVPAHFWLALGLYLACAIAIQILFFRDAWNQTRRVLFMGPLDYAVLTYIVHLMGSAPTPLTGLYVFISMMYGLIVSLPLAVALSATGTAAYAGVLLLEWSGHLPFAPAAPVWAPSAPPGGWMLVASAVLVFSMSVGSASFVGRLAALLRLREHELDQLSKRDPLTQLFNRRHLVERMALELSRTRRGHPLAMIMIDLDGFKRVNDEKGHLHGDDLLRAFATALVAGTRAIDVVSRHGGDEFVVLLPDTTLDQARLAAERLLDRIREVGAGPPPVTASVGVVEADPADDPEALLRRVDAGTYAAKRAGGDRVVAG
jgi:diguanylate cyclase (GGDEF)-like protein